jgi:hypothetical protein
MTTKYLFPSGFRLASSSFSACLMKSELNLSIKLKLCFVEFSFDDESFAFDWGSFDCDFTGKSEVGSEIEESSSFEMGVEAEWEASFLDLFPEIELILFELDTPESDGCFGGVICLDCCEAEKAAGEWCCCGCCDDWGIFWE